MHHYRYAHLSVCEIDGHAIALDLRADRYLLLPGQLDVAARASTGSAAPPEDAARNWLLSQAGLSGRTCRDRPEELRRVELAAPTLDLDDDLPPPTLARTVQALISRGDAMARLHFTRLDRLIARLEMRKAALKTSGGDPMRSIQLIIAAVRRADLLWSANQRCLAHSIATFEQLLSVGIATDLVLGVTMRPFSAHCWVQHGSTVLNDRVERVFHYRPILAI